jgi:type IV pilus assembly protein PilC
MKISLTDFNNNLKPSNNEGKNEFNKEIKKAKKTNGLSNILTKEINLFGSGLSLQKKEAFYSELQILLSAGLDLQRALTLVIDNQRKTYDKKLFSDIQQYIVDGLSLSASMEETRQFSKYEIFSIKIGEETGRLTAILNELAVFFQKSLQYRRKVFGALAYPIFVIVFALAVVVFLLQFLVPMFSGVYERFDKELPELTQKIVFLSNWMIDYSMYLFLGIGLLIVFLFTQRTKVWFRKMSSWLLVRLPIFGPLIREIYLVRFCQSMSLLLSSKVPLLKAVGLVKSMINFYSIEVALSHAEKEILNGSTLEDALQPFPFFPKQLLALVKVGEEASQLDTMFQKLGDQYNNAVEQRTEVLSSLIEPILIVGLGVLVGIVLIAMYLPLFQLSTGVN